MQIRPVGHRSDYFLLTDVVLLWNTRQTKKYHSHPLGACSTVRNHW